MPEAISPIYEEYAATLECRAEAICPCQSSGWSCSLASDNQTHNNKSLKILQPQLGFGSHAQNLHTVFGSRGVHRNLWWGSLGVDHQQTHSPQR